MQPEAKFRKRALNDLSKVPGLWGTRIEQQSIRGTPDWMGCCFGHFIAIEFKASSKAKVTELQKFVITEITKNGGTALIAFPENWNAIFADIMRFANEQLISNGGKTNDYTNVQTH